MRHANLKPHEKRKLDATFMRSWREDARGAQRSKCDYCRDPITAKTATADHVLARHNNGRDERNNIVAACRPCNQLKRSLPAVLFRRMIEAPKSGMPIGFWLAHARLRINRRLERMETFFDRFYGRR